MRIYYSYYRNSRKLYYSRAELFAHTDNAKLFKHILSNADVSVMQIYQTYKHGWTNGY